MGNFPKQVTTLFDNVVEKFEDMIVISSNVNQQSMPPRDWERSNDVFWRPVPYYPTVSNGITISTFNEVSQLSVPARVGFRQNAAASFTLNDMRDDAVVETYDDAAASALATAVNQTVLGTAAMGNLFVKRPAAATGFDDIAQFDSLMNEIGVPAGDRRGFLSSRDYNAMASNLAARQTLTDIPTKALREAYVGRVSSFETFKMDNSQRLLACVPGTGTVINGANQRYVPSVTLAASNGELVNVDNRGQNLNITVGAGGAWKVGDYFTIAGVEFIQRNSKQAMGQLRTFRIHAIVSGGGTAGANVWTVYSPIISADSAPTPVELLYRNSSTVPANGAAITPLNTATAGLNYFFHKSAIELHPSAYTITSGGGLEVIKATLPKTGLSLQLSWQGAISDLKRNARWDIVYGATLINPDMAGVMLFSQP